MPVSFVFASVIAPLMFSAVVDLSPMRMLPSFAAAIGWLAVGAPSQIRVQLMSTSVSTSRTVALPTARSKPWNARCVTADPFMRIVPEVGRIAMMCLRADPAPRAQMRRRDPSRRL
jgi:hypothetical protein